MGIALTTTSALAGPPFMTDDPVPTDTGHWEIYGPIVEGEGQGADFAGSVGPEINYGAAPDVQITVGLPVTFTHDATGMKWGAGDVGVSVKYRFYQNERTGLSIAAFPALTLPTASHGMGSGRVTAFLPVWAQKDVGQWSIFGGGGYAINPGAGNRNHWRGALAVTRQLNSRLLVGVEADRQGAETLGGSGSTRFGVGAIYHLKRPFRLLASGGPVFDDAGGPAGFHSFVALGLDF
jgi:hypothetical protein